ncbi:Acid sphingomyelinase-like phosphodiesterase 3a [Eumeta japonica]|uniref:Acid sphingomyelinase-like phosphodiesterase 3a n=1 Tax=Eumeta variegata TaxID=151549 RepID=A0A4C1WBL8_EUMVA|nr:Acid sphingomyelinase-like phosphodiesterase 3a [Eumeta japonica]
MCKFLFIRDILASRYGADEDQRFQAIRNMTDLLSRTFSSHFVFPVLGHLDPAPSENLTHLWMHWLPLEALQTFKNGGYYTIEQSHSKLRIVALNTNLFSSREAKNPHTDSQWSWLEAVLNKADSNKEMNSNQGGPEIRSEYVLIVGVTNAPPARAPPARAPPYSNRIPSQLAPQSLSRLQLSPSAAPRASSARRRRASNAICSITSRGEDVFGGCCRERVLMCDSTQVYIVGHVPPGWDGRRSHAAYSPEANSKYLRTVRRHAGIIAGQFFGHLHADTFRVIYDNDGKHVGDDGDVERRMNVGNKVNEVLLAIMNSKSVLRQARLIVHKGVLIPTLTCGREIWVWQNNNESRVNAVEIRLLRIMCGVSRKNKYGNSDVRERCGLKDDVVARAERDRAVSWALVAPAVSPRRDAAAPANPALRLYKFDTNTGKVLDYTQYYLNLSAANRDGVADWAPEYNLTQYYALHEVSAPALHALADKLRIGSPHDMTTFHRYSRAYNVKYESSEICDSACAHQHFCAVTCLEYVAYRQCVEAAASALAAAAADASFVAPFTSLTVVSLVIVIIRREQKCSNRTTRRAVRAASGLVGFVRLSALVPILILNVTLSTTPTATEPRVCV